MIASPTVMRGLREPIRILEDDLHLPAAPSQLGFGQLREVAPVERNRTRRRLDQPEQKAARCRLSATGLADQTQRFAGLHRQVDTVDGTCASPLPTEHAAAARRKPWSALWLRW